MKQESNPRPHGKKANGKTTELQPLVCVSLMSIRWAYMPVDVQPSIPLPSTGSPCCQPLIPPIHLFRFDVTDHNHPLLNFLPPVINPGLPGFNGRIVPFPTTPPYVTISCLRTKRHRACVLQTSSQYLG